MNLFSKKLKRLFNQKGQVARLFLVLAVVIFVALLLSILVIKMLERPAAPVAVSAPLVPLPVYDHQLGNIKFVFESAIDRGNTLKASDVVDQNFSNQKDMVTTERYIMVTVGAQNEGDTNTDVNGWDLGNVIDSDGRNFVPLDPYTVNAWLPANNNCGALLKPAFDPLPCTKIYEVSKESTGLKVQVLTGQTNNSANDMSAGRKISFNLDMIVK